MHQQHLRGIGEHLHSGVAEVYQIILGIIESSIFNSRRGESKIGVLAFGIDRARRRE